MLFLNFNELFFEIEKKGNTPLPVLIFSTTQILILLQRACKLAVVIFVLPILTKERYSKGQFKNFGRKQFVDGYSKRTGCFFS